MKTTILLFAVLLLSCEKEPEEPEKPKCFMCSTKKTTYHNTFAGYPKTVTGTVFESCTDITEKKRTENAGFTYITETSCVSK